MKCCVPKCKNAYKKDDNKNLGYHMFPKDKQLRKKWLQFCDMTEKDLILAPNKVVCSEHFADDCLKGYLKVEMGFGSRRFLRSDAIPTIQIPKECIRSKRLDKRNNKKIVDALLTEYIKVKESQYDAATQATEFVGIEEEILEIEDIVEAENKVIKTEEKYDSIEEEYSSTDQQEKFYKKEKTEHNPFEERIQILEKENKILRHEYSLLEERLSSIERRYQYELNDLKDKLEIVQREKEILEENLNAIQEEEIIWP